MNRLQVKLLSALNADALEYVPIFHQWIREHRLDELLIDVVDYSHVRHGPEVMLVGHESDYVIDRTGGRLGLLYVQKRPRPTVNSAWLWALKRALSAGALLQQETSPTTPLALRSDTMMLRVADRLSAPNSDATFKRVLPAVESALEVLYGQTPFTVTRVGTPRDLLTLEVEAPGAPTLDELLARLSGVN